MDLNAEIFIGTLEDTISSSSRTLHTKDPKRTKKYKDEVLEKFKQEQLFKSMRNLTTLVHRRGRWTTKMQTKYDKIDKKATHIEVKGKNLDATISKRKIILDGKNKIGWV